MDRLLDMTERIDSSIRRKAKDDQIAGIDDSINRTLAMISVVLAIIAIGLGLVALDLEAGVYLFVIGTILFGFFVGLLLPDTLRKVILSRLMKGENVPEVLRRKRI